MVSGVLPERWRVSRNLAQDAGIRLSGGGAPLAARTSNDGASHDASGHPWLMLAAMCLSTFMVQIDVTIVNIALPRIQSGLETSAGSPEWVISAYALSLATLIPISGVLGDRFGRRVLWR
jgi:Major Facilitator Superfamily